jgi:tripartite-type tricarboxylate transporter receptor subunit TctC
MRKPLCGLMVLCLLAILAAGCGTDGKSKPAEGKKFPAKPITIIVPFAAGGGGDIGARFLCAEAEKHLGQPITVVNKPGASGWLGWTELFAAKKDGYTLASTSDINILFGYLDPQQKRDKTIAGFAPIICYVKDYGAISVNKNETRFKDIKELVDYARTHEVTATAGGSTALVAMMKMNQKLGTRFIPVRNAGGAESLPAVMGGHVDVMFASMGETKVPAISGQVKPIAVMAEKRSEHLPNVPTVREAVGADVVSFAARGVTAAAGVDRNVLDVLIKAFEKAANAPAVQAKMREQGLDVTSIVGDDYMKLLQQEEKELKELAPLLGWKK